MRCITHLGRRQVAVLASVRKRCTTIKKSSLVLVQYVVFDGETRKLASACIVQPPMSLATTPVGAVNRKRSGWPMTSYNSFQALKITDFLVPPGPVQSKDIGGSFLPLSNSRPSRRKARVCSSFKECLRIKAKHNC
jgi:hypothetical protein